MGCRYGATYGYTVDMTLSTGDCLYCTNYGYIVDIPTAKSPLSLQEDDIPRNLNQWSIPSPFHGSATVVAVATTTPSAHRTTEVTE